MTTKKYLEIIPITILLLVALFTIPYMMSYVYLVILFIVCLIADRAGK